MEGSPSKKTRRGEPAPKAPGIADEIDDYLDQRVDPGASGEEEAAAVIDAHEGDPGFRDMVRRLSKALHLGK